MNFYEAVYKLSQGQPVKREGKDYSYHFETKTKVIDEATIDTKKLVLVADKDVFGFMSGTIKKGNVYSDASFDFDGISAEDWVEVASFEASSPKKKKANG